MSAYTFKLIRGFWLEILLRNSTRLFYPFSTLACPAHKQIHTNMRAAHARHKRYESTRGTRDLFASACGYENYLEICLPCKNITSLIWGRILITFDIRETPCMYKISDLGHSSIPFIICTATSLY